MISLIDIGVFKKKAKARYFTHIVTISLVFIFVIVGTLLSLLLSNLDYIINQIINIIITVLFFLFLVFYLLNIFPLVRHYYAYYKNLSDVNLDHRRRMVYFKEIDKKEINNVIYRVLQFVYSEGETEYNDNLYVLDSDVSFQEGQSYKLDTYQNVIVRYEAL